MNLIITEIEDIKIIEPKVFKDNRGFFMESFNFQSFKDLGLNYHFIQDNHSLSLDKNVIRGLHYQMEPMAQTKLVRVITGAIYDVAVDIRKGSPTFGKWIGAKLTENNHQMLLVPKGFAHGFCTLTHNTHVQYKVDNYYSPERDRGILWNDTELSIKWPTMDPILSEKDIKQPLLKKAENNFIYQQKAESNHE